MAIISLLEIGCAHLSGGDNLKISVQHIKVESWLNLMPGGPGSFHISGEMKIINEEDFRLENLNLSNLTVIQDDKELFSCAPYFSLNIFSPPPGVHVPITTLWLNPKEEKYYVFYTQSDIPINKDLDSEKEIKIVMFFTEGDISFRYQIENIKVEKVY